MSDTITPEEAANEFVATFGQWHDCGTPFTDRQVADFMRKHITTAIREAEARGEARCLRAITDRTNRHSMDDNLPALHESIECEKAILAVCSRRPIEGSETEDDMAAVVASAEARGEAREFDRMLAAQQKLIADAFQAGAADEREACAEIAGVSLDYAWVHEQILARSIKPIEASETDGMVEGYNGA